MGAAVLIPLPQGGSDNECAERLLLHHRADLRDPEVLAAVGSEALQKRLSAVGLRQSGSPLEQAKRLLFVLRGAGIDELRALEVEEVRQAVEDARRERLRQDIFERAAGEQAPAPQPIESYKAELGHRKKEKWYKMDAVG